MFSEYRKFYNENGYLPHRAAEAIIGLAENLKSGYDKLAANAVALEWRLFKLQEVAEKMAEALKGIECYYDEGRYDCGICDNYMDPKKHNPGCIIPDAQKALALFEWLKATQRALPPQVKALE